MEGMRPRSSGRGRRISQFALAVGASAGENGPVVASSPDRESLLASDETPEALEEASWTAWWKDDLQVVFDARASAYRRYRHRGDLDAAARMAIWLARDELDFNGAAEVAGGLLRRAERLLAGREMGPEHGWYFFVSGYLASWHGDMARTRELAVATASVGRRLAVTDLEMLGLALEGATLVSGGIVHEGMGRLHGATTIARKEGAAVPIAAGWTFGYQVAACLAVGDYRRAAEWCDRIRDFANRHGSRYMFGSYRAGYGAVELRRGNWTEAEGLLAASAEDFLGSRPALAGEPLAGLAELSWRQGRWTEAKDLVERAGSPVAEQLLAARLALEEGDAARAADLAERLVRQTPDENRLESWPALELLVQARARRGELDEARTALHALQQLEELVGTPAFSAARRLAEGRVAAAAGERERARTLLEGAVDVFERCPAPYEAAEARDDLARILAALRDTEAAASEVERAEAIRRRLGAPSRVRRRPRGQTP